MSTYPLFNEKTPIKDIPRDWLRYIEPKVVRRHGPKGYCWIWVGHLKQQKSIPTYPYVKIPVDRFDPKKGTKWTNARRYVAEMFFGDIPNQYVVYNTCYQPNCVNPNHLIISHRNDMNYKL